MSEALRTESRMNRVAFEKMIEENREWLARQPRTLERDHIDHLLRVFLVVMFDGQRTRETRIEAANFAMQTVTTVGYGNWEHPARKAIERPNQEDRIFAMRSYSIWFMFFGATFYTLLTGVVVASLSGPRPPVMPPLPPRQHR